MRAGAVMFVLVMLQAGLLAFEAEQFDTLTGPWVSVMGKTWEAD